MKMSTAEWWTEVTGENRSTRPEPVPVPHFLSQIPTDRPGSRNAPLLLLTARTVARPRPARLQEANSIALTDYQKEPRLTVHALPTELNKPKHAGSHSGLDFTVPPSMVFPQRMARGGVSPSKVRQTHRWDSKIQTHVRTWAVESCLTVQNLLGCFYLSYML